MCGDIEHMGVLPKLKSSQLIGERSELKGVHLQFEIPLLREEDERRIQAEVAALMKPPVDLVHSTQLKIAKSYLVHGKRNVFVDINSSHGKKDSRLLEIRVTEHHMTPGEPRSREIIDHMNQVTRQAAPGMAEAVLKHLKKAIA